MDSRPDETKAPAAQPPAPEAKAPGTTLPAAEVKAPSPQLPTPEAKAPSSTLPAVEVKAPSPQPPAPEAKAPSTTLPAAEVKAPSPQPPASEVKAPGTTLPATEVKAPSPQPPAPEVKAPTTTLPAAEVKAPGTQQPPVILYVEDDSRSRRVMQMIALAAGVPSMILFEDSTDFLARAEALNPRPDVIFLDIHLKPITGLEMLKLLRQSKHFDGVPIVAMTASVMNEEVEQLRTAGFDGCLAKPIDMDTFSEILKRIMRKERVWQIIS